MPVPGAPPTGVDAGVPVTDCTFCGDLGVVASLTRSKFRKSYRGGSLEGRYLALCPAIGCAAREREIGPVVLPGLPQPAMRAPEPAQQICPACHEFTCECEDDQ